MSVQQRNKYDPDLREMLYFFLRREAERYLK